VFEKVVLRGDAPRETDAVPAILWGYRQAARLRAWTVSKVRDPRTRQTRWRLVGRIERVDAFAIRQRQPPLVFTAPRPRNGLWLFPVVARNEQDNGIVIRGDTLEANLGQPEW
jgi:hypothetical protein